MFTFIDIFCGFSLLNVDCLQCYIVELLTVNSSVFHPVIPADSGLYWTAGLAGLNTPTDTPLSTAVWTRLRSVLWGSARNMGRQCQPITAQRSLLLSSTDSPHPFPTPPLPSLPPVDYPFLCHLTFYHQNFSQQFHPDWFYERMVLVTSLTRRHQTSALVRQDPGMVGSDQIRICLSNNCLRWAGEWDSCLQKIMSRYCPA